MTDFLAPWKFRFRGRTGRLLAIVECFRSEPNRGLAAVQIARGSGMSIHDAAKLLAGTPELFVKLPGRGDAITRYRLVSSMAARPDQEIERLVNGYARRESWILYAFMLMVGLLFVLVVMVVLPTLA